jgi:uncharacterized membrane protein
VKPERSSQQQQQRLLSLQAEHRYAGPIPPATEFQLYGQALPSAPERILAMAEAEARHRHEMEKTVLDQRGKLRDQEFKRITRGQYMASTITALAFCLAGYSAYLGQSLAALGIVITAIGSIAAVFVLNRKQKPPVSPK